MSADVPTTQVGRTWIPALVGGAIASLTYLILIEVVSSAMDTSAEDTAWFTAAYLLYWFMSLPVGLVFAGHGAWTSAAVLLFWCAVGGLTGVKVHHYSTLRGHHDPK